MARLALVDQATTTFGRWCAEPGDSDDFRTRKSHFAGAFSLVLPACLVWGSLLVAFGVPWAALGPWGHLVLGTASFALLRETGNFRFFQITQGTLILLSPFVLQLILYGYVGGSAAVVWCFLAPLFATLVVGRREAIIWYGLFLTILVVAAVAQPGLEVTNELPHWLINAFFVMNLGGPSAVAFAMLVSFVIAAKKLHELETSYVQQSLMLRNSEKLATLGTLAAGVAHELNNPAAAVSRAADQARTSIGQLQDSCFDLSTVGLEREQADALADLCAADAAGQDLTPLARSAREDDVEDWLTDRGVDKAWELSPLLVEAGLTPATLEAAFASFREDQLPAASAALGRGLASRGLLTNIADGASRISEIVSAMRSYSYLDQGTMQVADITEGLESTLVLMRAKLVDMTVVRDYSPGLPRVSVRGSELNQVWTNIIDNACDATGGKGTLTVRTSKRGDRVLVEIQDDGPGMSAESAQRVFDPFFTTKPPGQGTGLGMNISHNIVVGQHRGEISVHSQPGATVFRIELPIKAPASPDGPHEAESAPSRAEERSASGRNSGARA